MKKKFLAIIMTALLLTLMLCSCSSAPDADSAAENDVKPEQVEEKAEEKVEEKAEETAKEVLDKMNAAMAETPCTVAKLTTVIDSSLTGEGIDPIPLKTDAVSDISICQNPVSSYTALNVSVAVSGETYDESTVSYIVQEDGKLAAYSNKDNIWIKLDMPGTVEELASSASEVDVNADNADIDRSVTDYSGKKAICVVSTITGEDLRDVVINALDSIAADAGSSSDLTPLSGDVRLYIDPETYLPMAEVVEISGMEKVIESIFSDSGLAASINECRALGEFISFDAIPEIVVPEKAIADSTAWARLLDENPDNGDGTFTIREGAVLADIVPPEGFELSEEDYDHVTFTRDDHRTVTYMMYYVTDDSGLGTYFQGIAESDASRWETNGGKVTRNAAALSSANMDFDSCMLDTVWSGGLKDSHYYAWSPFLADGDGTVYYLYVTVSDGYSDGFGNSKNSDLTAEDFVSYLDCASYGKLMG